MWFDVIVYVLYLYVIVCMYRHIECKSIGKTIDYATKKWIDTYFTKIHIKHACKNTCSRAICRCRTTHFSGCASKRFPWSQPWDPWGRCGAGTMEPMVAQRHGSQGNSHTTKIKGPGNCLRNSRVARPAGVGNGSQLMNVGGEPGAT